MRRSTPFRLLQFLLVAALLAGSWWLQSSDEGAREPPPHASGGEVPATRRDVSLPSFLPPEARDTLDLIARGGPFPHRQDGTVFRNRERRLPSQPVGWYREYTVRTPGLSHRGPRRIVTGGDPPVEFHYTDDHYASFRRFEVAR